jgi:predicted nucleic acid-binding protein
MSRVLVDTSVFIETERRNLQALERLDELMDEGPVGVSVVTVAELLSSPTLSAGRRRFYADFFAAQVEILPASAESAYIGVAAARETGGSLAPDILIAGTALAHRLKLVTFDAGLARLMGSEVELLRKS